MLILYNILSTMFQYGKVCPSVEQVEKYSVRNKISTTLLNGG